MERNERLIFTSARCFSRSRWEKEMLATCLTWLDRVSNGGIERMKSWNVSEIGSLGRRKRENIFCLQIYIFLYLCDSVDFEEFKFLCKQKIVQKYQNINSRKKEERENPCFIYNIRVFGILRFFIASIKLVPTRFKSSRSRGACLSIHLTISLIKPSF